VSRPQRVGLIVPSSNTVMEPAFHRHLPNAIVSTTRILLEEVTPEAELRMLEEDLPRAAVLVKTTIPDIVVFGCTSAGSLGGLGQDDGIRKMLEQRTGATVMTIVRSVLAGLRRSGSRKVAVFTPYEQELTRSIAQSLEQGGYMVVKAEGMGIRRNFEIGKVPPPEIARFVEPRMQNVDADSVVLSCTNWQALEALDALQDRLGIPILSSNQAAIEAVRLAAPEG
jgi:maleate isomerase